MALAREQLGAHVFFQQPKLPRDGRLDQIEQLRCPGHVGGVGHGQERAKLFEVHGCNAAMKRPDGLISNFYLSSSQIRFYDSFIAKFTGRHDQTAMDNTPA